MTTAKLRDRRSPRELFPTVVVAIVVAAYFLFLAMSRWNAGKVTNYDLGIFSQSARSWSAGHLPYSDLRQLHLLGDHFSPILAVFGPAWRLWPDPRVLLVLQAACLGAAVGLIHRFARRNLGAKWALWIVAVAVASRGVLSAALFDVHEVAIAAPAVVVLCMALRDARFVPAVAAAVILGLTKEDMGLTIGMAGVCWWLMHRRSDTRHRLHAAVLSGIGALSLAVANVVIRAVNGGSEYTHYFSGGGYTAHDLVARATPVALFVVTTLVVGLRSPIALVAAPTLAWRVLANNPNYWDTGFHYDVVPWAVALVAAVDGISRTSSFRVGAARVVIAGASVVAVGLGVFTIGDRWGGPAALVSSSRGVRDVEHLTTRVPDGARVAAINSLGSYVVARTRTFNLRPGLRQPVDYLLFATSGPWSNDFPVWRGTRCLPEPIGRAGRSGPPGRTSWFTRGTNRPQRPRTGPVEPLRSAVGD